jgi:hypothetical protein
MVYVYVCMAGLGEGPLPLWVEAVVRLFAEEGQGKDSKSRKRKKVGDAAGSEEKEEEARRYTHELRKVGKAPFLSVER